MQQFLPLVGLLVFGCFIVPLSLFTHREFLKDKLLQELDCEEWKDAEVVANAVARRKFGTASPKLLLKLLRELHQHGKVERLMGFNKEQYRKED